MKKSSRNYLPEFPDGITPDLGHLKKAIPTVEIIVEDQGDVSKKIWVSLLMKIVPEGFKISIHGSGGKGSVLSGCEADQEDDSERMRLYIIDADLDMLMGVEPPKLKNLYRLQAYCIENYLFEESNILELCRFFHARSSHNSRIKSSNRTETEFGGNDYNTQFNFDGWKRQNSNLFEELYVAYAAIQKLNAGIMNVGYPIKELCKSPPNSDSLEEKEVENRIKTIRNLLLKKGFKVEQIESEFKNVSKIAKSMCFMSYVDGKNHLLTLFRIRLKDKFSGSNVKNKLIFDNLAENISPDCDPVLC